MEFNVNTNCCTMNAIRVLKINNTISVEGYKKSHDLQNKISLIIDDVGKMSAAAQGLDSPITSTSELMNSDQIIYMMTEQNTPAFFVVVGILKMGWKHLYLNDKTGSRSEATVYCLFDFYIHESRQRKGYGKYLIDHMMQDMNLEAKNLAINRPSTKLLQFMWKHYQLSELIYQGNDIVIFNDYFNNGRENNNYAQKNDHDYIEIRSHEYQLNQYQPYFGPFENHTHYNTTNEIANPHSAEDQVEFPINMDGHFLNRNHNILYNSLSL